MRRSIAVVVLVALLAGACDSRGSEQMAVASSIGDQLAASMQEPLQQAVSNSGNQSASGALSLAMHGAIAELDLPDNVDAILRGGSEFVSVGGQFASVATSLTVLLSNGPGFCAVVAVASDGRVVARPDPANAPSCSGVELPDLTQRP